MTSVWPINFLNGQLLCTCYIGCNIIFEKKKKKKIKLFRRTRKFIKIFHICLDFQLPGLENGMKMLAIEKRQLTGIKVIIIIIIIVIVIENNFNKFPGI